MGISPLSANIHPAFSLRHGNLAYDSAYATKKLLNDWVYEYVAIRVTQHNEQQSAAPKLNASSKKYFLGSNNFPILYLSHEQKCGH